MCSNSVVFSLDLVRLISLCAVTFDQIRFEDYQFKLKDINDKSEVINFRIEADIQRFYEHFQVEDYLTLP